MMNIENGNWSLPNRGFLRFTFLYLLFYIYPYGFEYVIDFDTEKISFWKNITIWFGEFFLGWEFDSENLLNGFDSKYDYSRFLLITLLSISGTTLWLFIDSRFKLEYNQKLQILFRTILRYHVGLTLILYGLAKVFMLQFGEMSLDTLENSVGNHNGMRFLWIFMSYSKFYTMSTGWIEVIGGVLLLFRKSTFIGSCILFIAMANVVLLDIGYDVRVKMFAIHLLLMTILLLSNDLKRIVNFFVLNKPTEASIEHSLFTSKKSKKIKHFIKGGILLCFAVLFFFDFSKRIYSQKTNNYPTLTAFHRVESQIINGDTIPETSKHKWKTISINGSSWRPESLTITDMTNKRTIYSFKADTIQHTIEFYPFRDSISDSYKFKYKELTDKTFIFEGFYQGDSILIKTEAKTLDDYPLTSNKIKWITDFGK